jgi:hypothetical protein
MKGNSSGNAVAPNRVRARWAWLANIQPGMPKP